MSDLISARDVILHEARYPYLVKPIIPQGGIVFMHGKRGIGKTHFGLTLAACLSAGGTLFGRYTTKPSSVVYIQADTPYPVQRDRLVKASQITTFDHVYYHFPKYFNLLQLRETDELVEQINMVEPDLIIWDTLRKIHRSSSNDDDVPSLVYGTAQWLFPDATHMFVHHDKKTVVDQAQLEKEEYFRGSGAWLDDADTGLHLTSPSKGHLVLAFTKVRTCEDQDPIGLTLNKDALLLHAVGDVSPLVREWRAANPEGSADDLRFFLIASGACSPRSVERLIHQHLGE